MFHCQTEALVQLAQNENQHIKTLITHKKSKSFGKVPFRYDKRPDKSINTVVINSFEILN